MSKKNIEVFIVLFKITTTVPVKMTCPASSLPVLFVQINAQALSNALSVDTKPWISLGQMLGRIAALLLGQVNSQTQARLNTEGGYLSYNCM